MQPPIVIDARGDVLIFNSKEEAENYLEAVDVANGEYAAYDSEGRLLRLMPAWPHSATIADAEIEPGHKHELHGVLSRFLVQLGLPVARVERASLDQLIKKARQE